MNLNIINKNLFFIKLISLLSLCLIFFPSDKFSLPYIGLILIGTIDDLSDFRLSNELITNLLCLTGFIMVFNKRKYVILISYLLASFLIPVFLYYKIGKLDILFWLPFIIFVITSFYVIYIEFKNITNE